MELAQSEFDHGNYVVSHPVIESKKKSNVRAAKFESNRYLIECAKKTLRVEIRSNKIKFFRGYFFIRQALAFEFSDPLGFSVRFLDSSFRFDFIFRLFFTIFHHLMITFLHHHIQTAVWRRSWPPSKAIFIYFDLDLDTPNWVCICVRHTVNASIWNVWILKELSNARRWIRYLINLLVR